MHVLIVKTSSLGDVIHTLPALTDAIQARPDIQFDWVVEEAFKEIPSWHSAVVNVVPIALRRWRSHLLTAIGRREIAAFRAQLSKRSYDKIIDAQGLLKSAWVSQQAKGLRSGLSWNSAREPLASLCYQQRLFVPKNLHAVERLRRLFALCLDYCPPQGNINYGLRKGYRFKSPVIAKKLIFSHSTSWASKLWPEFYWRRLCAIALQQGYYCHLPWGSKDERQRAERIAMGFGHVQVLPAMTLQEIAEQLVTAAGVVSVDTGIGQLAAALDVPTLSLYGASSPILTGTTGKHQLCLSAQFSCAPCLNKKCNFSETSPVQPACFEQLSPEEVWRNLAVLMRNANVIATSPC